MSKDLLQKINSRKANIAVIGLGYVGAPLVKGWTAECFDVVGYDLIKEKGEKLHKKIKDNDDGDRFKPTTKEEDIYKCDIFVICVPTPIKSEYMPDLNPIKTAVEAIKTGCLVENKDKERLVIVTSTVYPGFTREEVFAPLMNEGINIRVAFASEREDPGNFKYNLINTPKIIGGIGCTAGLLAEQLFNFICMETKVVDTPEIAEASKLLENMFRYVNISFINEFAQYCNLLEIPPLKVIEAAGTKPFGFMKFLPGTGIGGHCIPVDPHYFNYRVMKKLELESDFIELCIKQDSETKMYNSMLIYHLVKEILKLDPKKVKVLIIGIAYKPNVGDTRNSPAKRIMETLEDIELNFEYHDTYVDSVLIKNKLYKNIAKPVFSKYDVVVLHTLHDYLSYEKMESESKCILDLTGRGRFLNKKGNVYNRYGGMVLKNQNLGKQESQVIEND